MKKIKLLKILEKLTPKVEQSFTSIDEEVGNFSASLKDGIASKKLKVIKQNFDILVGTIKKLRLSLIEREKEISFKTKLNSKEIQEVKKLQKQNLELAKTDLKTLEESFIKTVSQVTEDLSNLSILEKEDVEKFTDMISDLRGTIKELRKNLMTRINDLGGGNMNRQIKFNGVDYLTKYTDINYKAGSNVTFTVQNNEQTKMVDVTITGTSTGGMVRVITSISTNTVAGSADGTDYVYLVSGTTTLTLPTAVGNENLYTVKNVGSGVVTINTTGGELIDNDLTVIMPVQYTSVDLISDTANWNIT